MQNPAPRKGEALDRVRAVEGFGVIPTTQIEEIEVNTNATTAAAEADRRQEQTDDADFALHQAMHLADLMAYIERARHLCDAVSQYANMAPRFREELQAANINYGYPDWTDNVSEGMAVLHSVQWRLVREARAVISPETKPEVH